jgi:hypothetical protein
MNIPVISHYINEHPVLNENVFQGSDYRQHAALYNSIQQIVEDPTSNIHTRIEDIQQQLQNFELEIIDRTKSSITPHDQASGRLIQRTSSDAIFLNDMSSKFFEVINDVCRQAKLANQVYTIKAAAVMSKKKAIVEGKIIPGIASFPLTKQLDDALKRARAIHQRILLICRDISRIQRTKNFPQQRCTSKKRVIRAVIRFNRHQHELLTSMRKVISLCNEVAEERSHHIETIEKARNRKCFDHGAEYQMHVIEKQGRQEHDRYIQSVKNRIFGHIQSQSMSGIQQEKLSGYVRLLHLTEKWKDSYGDTSCRIDFNPSDLGLKYVYKVMSKVKGTIKDII